MNFPAAFTVLSHVFGVVLVGGPYTFPKNPGRCIETTDFLRNSSNLSVICRFFGQNPWLTRLKPRRWPILVHVCPRSVFNSFDRVALLSHESLIAFIKKCNISQILKFIIQSALGPCGRSFLDLVPHQLSGRVAIFSILKWLQINLVHTGFGINLALESVYNLNAVIKHYLKAS